jgi:CIC family chloride channel protein
MLAAVTGVLTGLGVALFEWVTREQVFARVADAPLAVRAVAPGVGLAITAAALIFLGRRATPATADEYIRNFHQRGRPLDRRRAPARLLGGVATLGSGGALGFEGPSLYLGAVLGTTVQRVRGATARHKDSKVLMVAGAAAGVAAIFKAPATGAVFALESPYRDDNARRMLLPALLAAAVGYLTAVSVVGTEPLFAVDGTPPFDLRELGGAVVLGLVCGLGARGFALLLRWAKALASRSTVLRVGAAGAALAALALVSESLFGDDLALGAGYRTLDWVTEPNHALPAIGALFAVRLLATTATVAGGGVGGLFIPLVIAGAVLGDGMATLVHDDTNLFPLIGVAAFLGAGYRTPLAGVMFVAEVTGRPGFVVPGLIASVASQLVMGDVSVSEYQTAGRAGHLERRFGLPVSAALESDVLTAPSDVDLESLYGHHLLLTRGLEVPVVDGDTYRGMLALAALREIPRAEWPERTAGDVADATWPVATLAWSLEQAVRAMNDRGVDSMPVLDHRDRFVGVVTVAAAVRLDEILHTGDRHTDQEET